MPHICTDCRSFLHCEKNSEAWEKAKELYPVPVEQLSINKMPQTHNERMRIEYINTIAGRCQERVTA